MGAAGRGSRSAPQVGRQGLDRRLDAGPWWPTTMMASSQPLACAWRRACSTSGIHAPIPAVSGHGRGASTGSDAGGENHGLGDGQHGGHLIPRPSGRIQGHRRAVDRMWRGTSRSCYISRLPILRSRARGNRGGYGGRGPHDGSNATPSRFSSVSAAVRSIPAPERAARRSRFRLAQVWNRRRARRSLQHRRSAELLTHIRTAPRLPARSAAGRRAEERS